MASPSDVNSLAAQDNEENFAGHDAINSDSSDEPPAKKQRLPKSEKKRIRKEAVRELHRTKRREMSKKKRKKDQHARRLTLEAMTDEERIAFLQQDRKCKKDAACERAAHLEKSFNEGKPKIVVNCGFDASMNDKELTSLAKQLQLSYGLLKACSIPFQLHVTSFCLDSGLQPRLEKFGYSTWSARFYEKPYWEVFSSVIVLSPDAEEDLEEVDPDATYVLGGLVDRTVSKYETLVQAAGKEAVVRCLRLPIRRYGRMGCASVLNIDRVILLLVRRLEGISWTDALEECLPQRHLTPGVRMHADTK